jgi:hypothetical protein
LISGTKLGRYEKYVAEGKLLSWGVLGAYIGGPANRTVYVWAKDPVALVQARLQYLPEIMAKPGWAEATRLCPTQTVSLRSLLLVSAPPNRSCTPVPPGGRGFSRAFPTRAPTRR